MPSSVGRGLKKLRQRLKSAKWSVQTVIVNVLGADAEEEAVFLEVVEQTGYSLTESVRFGSGRV